MDRLKPGDSCLECLELGLDHKLRLFYINLEEELLKCESRTCLWPHNDEVFSDEDVDFADPAETDLNVWKSDHSSASFSSPPAYPAPKTTDKVESSSYPEEASFPATEPDDDDEFIIGLLQQLDPAPQIVSSLPELSSEAHPETKTQSDFDMPNLMDFNIDFPEPETEPATESEKPPLDKESGHPPTKLKIKEQKGSLLKSLKSQLSDKLNSSSEKELKSEEKFNPVPADIKPQITNNQQIDPFSSPLKKASTQPRSPQPALNIIISIPELKKPNSFLDVIKRHNTERSSGARGEKRNRHPGRGRGRYTKAVKHLFDNLENTNGKQTPPRP
ncbi:hypothetical protein KR067_011762 [Drosophila pandora]|nr:hypothetical protein KR067_011762 [Drosophila pandora]